MHFLELLAEQKLKEAIERGDFDELPGKGKPLPEEDINPFIPVENRAAYRVLKNAGYLPPELQHRREALLLAESLVDLPATEVSLALKKLALLNAKLSAAGLPVVVPDYEYGPAVLRKLSGNKI